MFFFFIQAYFRQGVALQYLGRHADALAAFASGLAQDPKSLQLLVGMVEAAMKSPLRGRLVAFTPSLCSLSARQSRSSMSGCLSNQHHLLYVVEGGVGGVDAGKTVNFTAFILFFYSVTLPLWLSCEMVKRKPMMFQSARRNGCTFEALKMDLREKK